MEFEGLSDLLALLESSRVAEIELEEVASGRLLRVKRSATSGVVPRALEPDDAAGAPQTPAHVRVEARFVGRFYGPRVPIEPGASVVEDQILGSIESMQLMNPIAAPAAGRLAAVHVATGQPVEYGQLLYEIEAD